MREDPGPAQLCFGTSKLFGVHRNELVRPAPHRVAPRMDNVGSMHPIAIEGLGKDGATVCRAAALSSTHLAVEIEGSEAYVQQASRQLIGGPLNVTYRGVSLVLSEFTILHQGDRQRIVFRAAHQIR